MGYIDIHAHIIPGIDDGPKSIEKSKEMLHKVFLEGFHTIIATPHAFKGFTSYTKEDILERCSELEEYAKTHIHPDISVLPGQEIFFNETALHMIRTNEVIPMANSNYILIEFSPDVTFSYMLRGLREAAMSSYNIVLAHVERYACLKDLDRVKELRSNGILTQMNYKVIGDKWFRPTTIWARKCLKHGLIDFLGTDMHDNKDLSKLKQSMHWLQNNIDEIYMQKITYANAYDIFLHNE